MHPLPLHFREMDSRIVEIFVHGVRTRSTRWGGSGPPGSENRNVPLDGEWVLRGSQAERAHQSSAVPVNITLSI